MWLLAMLNVIAPAAEEAEMDRLMVFGFLSAFATLVVGMHQRQSRRCLLAFAFCLMATSVYGFMQGAWPIGFVQGGWAITVIRQWVGGRNFGGGKGEWEPRRAGPSPISRSGESRITRMFGPM